MNITRRGFIKGMGAAAGATGLSISLANILLTMRKPRRITTARSFCRIAMP